ncbi:potassium-transporting ATPase subunit KdpC [Kitasatospora acidiphila]|uniref:Potassium-transporting ATPase KdpC subunit n=1 Tax=Kitasatospora acidiphila TaxID=2567942 RepID=A0A540VWI2_9ACTN|nr:potassium-transporting ATPase subunit KdpC [Kitasatospora acidiphila]TQF01126.1 potassium-transporting ATPase subunit KdpC [Kitasatospora acidiphila]
MPRSLTALVRLHLTGLRLLLVFTVVCGLAYPLLITGFSQLALSQQADGSQLRQDGRVVGSSLLGQAFNLPNQAGPDPKWFQPRPSAAGTNGYDPTASGASNLGPNDNGLTGAIRNRRTAIAAFDGVPGNQLPPDAVTASGSGLDPQISPAYAYEQVNRVARVRRLDPNTVRQLVRDHVQGRILGFLGEPRVNVVTLNLALARLG